MENEGATTMTAGVSTDIGSTGSQEGFSEFGSESAQIESVESDLIDTPIESSNNESEEAADALLNSAKEDGFEEALTLFAEDKLDENKENKDEKEQEIVEGEENEGEEIVSLEEEEDPFEKEIEDKAEVVEKKVDDFLEEAKKDPELLTPEARAAIAQEVLFDMLMLLAELEKQKKKKKKGGLWEFLFMMIGEMLRRIFDPEGEGKKEKPVQKAEDGSENDYEGMLEVLAGMNKAA